jgi:hypothetical protein
MYLSIGPKIILSSRGISGSLNTFASVSKNEGYGFTFTGG